MPGDFHWYIQGLQIASKHQLAEISTRLSTLRHSATGPHGPTLPVVRPLEGCWKSAKGPGAEAKALMKMKGITHSKIIYMPIPTLWQCNHFTYSYGMLWNVAHL